MRLIAIIAALALTGCATAQEQAAQLEAAQHNKCSNYGLIHGTPEYAACRANLDQIKAGQDQIYLRYILTGR